MKIFRYELEINENMGTNMGRDYFQVNGIVAARNIMGAMNKIYEFYTDSESTICSIKVYEDGNELHEISCEQI